MDDSSTTFAVVLTIILIIIACLVFGIGGHPDGDPSDPYGMPARAAVVSSTWTPYTSSHTTTTIICTQRSLR